MWVKEDIPVYFEHIQWLAKERGFIASIYGSLVTKGYSDHDFDIMLVPYVHSASKELFTADIISFFKGTLVTIYKGIFATSVVIDIDSKRLDISIRKLSDKL